MTHAHHHHEIDPAVASLNRSFRAGIALNVAFVVVEFAVGIWYGSMGLLSDAGHNLSDVASLLLALLAFRLAQAPATPRYTYGYKKSTVLISLLNSMILLVAVGVIVAESVGRLLHPAPIEGGAIAWTAGIGVVVNGFTAWLFMKEKDRDLNVRGAYLHMAADALVSIGVVVSGLVISWTGWTLIDPIVGLAVACVIIASVWSLTRDSLRLSLDGVPDGIDLAKIEQAMCRVEGVAAVHHIHVWAISTTENALTAHVVLSTTERLAEVKAALKATLAAAGIRHVTLEFETAAEHCADLRDCSPPVVGLPRAAIRSGDALSQKRVTAYVFRSQTTGNGVVDAAARGMAAGQAAQGEPRPLDRAVFAQRLQRILRAGGREAARGRREGRDAQLIEAHQHDQRQGAEPLTDAPQPIPESGGRHGQWFCRRRPPSRSR